MNNLSPSYHAMTYAHEACAGGRRGVATTSGSGGLGPASRAYEFMFRITPRFPSRQCLLAGWVCLFLAALPLLADPTITQDPTNLCVSLGGDARFQVSVGGTSPFDFQWHFTNNGTTFPLDSVPNPSSVQRVLRLTNVLSSDAGGYFVVVTNTVGSATSQVAQLIIDPTFIQINDSPVVTNRANWNIGSWVDYDEDGSSDLYMGAGVVVSGQAPALYHNDGGTNFVLLTTNDVGAMVASTAGMSGVGLWGDFDNDDRIDLLELRVAASGSSSANRFFRGRADGTFELIAANLGVNRPPMPVYNGATVDYDNDGFLDVYFCAGAGIGTDLLYRNLGNGTFTNVWSPRVATQYSCWADYDNDGDMDVWVTDHSGRKPYRNNGDGTFTLMTGTNIPSSVHLLGTWGDYDNDRYFDFLNGPTLFRNDQHGGFTVATNHLPSGFDQWADYDNDGNLDFVAGGLPCVFYRNNGDSTLSRIRVGSPTEDAPGPEAMMSWCDYDNDGFLDLVIATRPNPSGPSLLYRNRGVEGGNTNHWLTVRLKGIVSNRSAIGAKVCLQAMIRGTNTWQLRQILGNYYDDQRAHFGLGDATKVETLRIEWPSGIVQELKDVAADQHLKIVEHEPYSGPSPRLTAVTPSTAGLQLTIQEPNAGARYALEGSTDLSRWAMLLSRTSAGGTQSFTDTKTTNYPARYYRVQVP